jgi:uncharacterized protein YndB with AHSA1/START domain
VTEFGTQIPITAPAETIWALLTNASGYPAWNSTVGKIDGRIAPGEKITLHLKPPGRAFPLQVSEWEAPVRMVWTGGMPLGLLTGKRTFALTPAPDGVVHFSMGERFTGPMAWLITLSMSKLLPGMTAFVNDLKREAERAG